MNDDSGVGRVQYFVDRAQDYHSLELGFLVISLPPSSLFSFCIPLRVPDKSRPTTSESAKIIIYTIERGDRNIENGSNILSVDVEKTEDRKRYAQICCKLT